MSEVVKVVITDLLAFAGPPDRLAPTKKPTERIHVDSLPAPVQAWLRAVKARSENTHDAYHLAISLWLRWCLNSGVDPETPELEDAEAWLQHLMAPKPEGKGLSPNSANARISAVSSLYRRLLRQNRITYNPFPAVLSVKIETDDVEVPAIPPVEAKKMLRQVATHDHKADAAVLELMLSNGARATEIGKADVGHLTADGHGWKLKVTRKGRKVQHVPVTPRAYDAIQAANADRGVLPDDAPLLVGPRGARYSRHTISRLVHRVAREAKVKPELAEKITAHTTRRTAATNLHEQGTELRVIQTLLGHKDPRTTEGYIKASTDREKHAAAAMALSAMFH